MDIKFDNYSFDPENRTLTIGDTEMTFYEYSACKFVLGRDILTVKTVNNTFLITLSEAAKERLKAVKASRN
ncbi:MAG: hypothetical protein ACM3SM_09870 [Bacteroidota bacterium]